MFCLYGNHQIERTKINDFSDNDNNNVSFREHYSRGQKSETNNENLLDKIKRKRLP